MSSVSSSQSVILTTAMAVSGALFLLSLCRAWNFPSTHQNSDSDSQSSHNVSSYPSRSCLSSGALFPWVLDGKRRMKNKQKRVTFADNVKHDKTVISGEIGKKSKKEKNKKCLKAQEYGRMPANRAALYHGILRDRVHPIDQYSY